MIVTLTQPCQGQQLTRGPYLQVGSSSSVVIRWRTDLPAGSQVICGTNLSALNLTNTVAEPTQEHVIRLTGLDPETTYFYSVGTSGSVLSPAGPGQWFRTSPPEGSVRPVRVWVLGDPGIGNADQFAVRDAFYRFAGNSRVDAVLTLGDTVYWYGTDEELQTRFFEVYPELFRKTVVWPSLGNHDTAQSTVFTTNYPYFASFTLPAGGEAGGIPSGTPHYYSFNYANIHFVSLDSTTADRSAGGPMATWLDRDLEANTNQWLIAYWHHPPYSKGSHDSDGFEAEMDGMRTNIVPILESHGADLVLCGHSHSYERSYLLNGHYGLSTTLIPEMILDRGTGREAQDGPYLKPRGSGLGYSGTVYAVVGSSGWVGGGAFNHPVMCVSSNVLASLVLDIHGDRLDALCLGAAGETNDWFTLLKSDSVPAVKTHFSVPADLSSILLLAGSETNPEAHLFATVSRPGRGLLGEIDPGSGACVYTPARGFQGRDSFTTRVSNGTATSAVATVTITVRPPPDTNSNLLPDDWEATYRVTDPAGDPDQDKLTNAQEYLAGTNPLNPESRLRFESVQWNLAATCILRWHGIAGVRYRLLFSDGGPNGSLSNPFVALARPIDIEMAPGSPGTPVLLMRVDDFSLSGVPPHGSRFYKLEIVR